MSTRYQTYRMATGEIGGVFDSATEACIWIAEQPDRWTWDWRPVASTTAPDSPAQSKTAAA
jgi:hypothetical protein